MGNDFANKILLTGAGYTKNFGGFLGHEMSSRIFNRPQVQHHQRLANLLREDIDYESIYYKVLGGGYNNEEKATITAAVFETYRELDNIVREWKFTRNAPYPVNIYKVNEMIERFAGEREQLGFFFTLNQDLFIERHSFSRGLRKPLILTGIGRIPPNILNKNRLDNQDFITLPTRKAMDNHPVNPLSTRTLHYVKLHGSYGWKSSDGANRLVIGRNKAKQIAEEPLLAWYFDLFKKTLFQEARKLIVIGYSFRDDHINKVIAESIQRYDLKLCVLSPSDQASFSDKLKKVTYGEQILSGLSGYFPYTLLEVFPSDQSESHAWRELKERYFLN